MLKKTLFYLITEHYYKNFEKTRAVYLSKCKLDMTPEEFIACEQIIEHWNQKKRVYIHCDNQIQAEKIDEFLWTMELEHFIPHNLVGEGLKNGSPIEIGWNERKGTGRRDVLINLQVSFPVFASVYQDVIDFVPFEEDKKAFARERYKSYKDIGFNLKTIQCE